MHVSLSRFLYVSIVLNVGEGRRRELLVFNVSLMFALSVLRRLSNGRFWSSDSQFFFYYMRFTDNCLNNAAGLRLGYSNYVPFLFRRDVAQGMVMAKRLIVIFYFRPPRDYIRNLNFLFLSVWFFTYFWERKMTQLYWLDDGQTSTTRTVAVEGFQILELPIRACCWHPQLTRKTAEHHMFFLS